MGNLYPVTVYRGDAASKHNVTFKAFFGELPRINEAYKLPRIEGYEQIRTRIHDVVHEAGAIPALEVILEREVFDANQGYLLSIAEQYAP